MGLTPDIYAVNLLCKLRYDVIRGIGLIKIHPLQSSCDLLLVILKSLSLVTAPDSKAKGNVLTSECTDS